MKSVFIENPHQVEMKDIPRPVRKPGEALLKLLYGGICGILPGHICLLFLSQDPGT